MNIKNNYILFSGGLGLTINIAYVKCHYYQNIEFKRIIDYFSKNIYERYNIDILSEIQTGIISKKNRMILHFVVEYAYYNLAIKQFGYPCLVIGVSMGEIVHYAFNVPSALWSIIELIYTIAKEDYEYNLYIVIADPSLLENEDYAIKFSDNHYIYALEKTLSNQYGIYDDKMIFPLYLPPFHTKYIEKILFGNIKINFRVKESKFSVPIYSCAYSKIIFENTNKYVWDVVRNRIDFSKDFFANNDKIVIDVTPNKDYQSVLVKCKKYYSFYEKM